MEKFIKKYSNVPNKFIEEFFNISKEIYDDNERCIDFDIVVKWLNVRKDNLKALLVKKFEKDFDYDIIIKKVKNKIGAATNYVDFIQLTPDCFKALCMLSQTAKAADVRKYYLSIEKLIRRYHELIEARLNEKIGLLKISQKPKTNYKGGIIYFFRAMNQISDNEFDELQDSLFKIGKTEDKKERFGVYGSENAHDLEPLFVIEVDNITKVENCIKELIKGYRYHAHKEIYEIDIDLLKEAFVRCSDLVAGFKKYTLSTKTKIANAQFKKLRHAEYGIFIISSK
jgi:phage anti-repressor protein